MLSVVILATCGLAAALLIHPRLSHTTHWGATVTPLASIIGSGFLVLGPILHAAYGTWAPLGMALLCVLAYAFGAAIRFNISYLDGQARPWSRLDGWTALTLIFGLLVTVQGFETSRYLGDEYDAETRVATMRTAQWISGGIYMVYALLLCALFLPGTGPVSETAIISMMSGIDPVLPALLIIAALSAQFSAAVADTGGSGGLLAELTRGRLSARAGYAILVLTGVAMTWTLSVFDIIGYASRAFALYYALQALLAARRAWAMQDGHPRAAGFFLLALLGAAIAGFGSSIE